MLKLFKFIIIQVESADSATGAVYKIIFSKVLVLIKHWIYFMGMSIRASSFILLKSHLGKLVGTIFPLPSQVPI